MEDKQIPVYRAYCDICNEPSTWYEMTASGAKAWRELHFKDQHPENPMKKANCRIQREYRHVEEIVDNPVIQAQMVDAMADE